MQMAANSEPTDVLIAGGGYVGLALGLALSHALDGGSRVRIVDPGSEAVGFELDVCLPAQGGVRCANALKSALQ